MTFVLDHQLALLLTSFSVGCVGVTLIFRHPAGSRVWKIADLLWVILGGVGALTAVLAGIYKSDSTLLDRQIDIAYAHTVSFDRDAARFRLRHCENGPFADLETLCEKVEFLSASTAGNADLPVFETLTRARSALRNLSLFGRDTDATLMSDLPDDLLGTSDFLAFVALDDTTRPALTRLRETRPEIAADFQILANSYDDLITQMRRLLDEWTFLRANTAILVLQILALCLVAFAAPFRLGKSLSELR